MKRLLDTFGGRAAVSESTAVFYELCTVYVVHPCFFFFAWGGRYNKYGCLGRSCSSSCDLGFGEAAVN